MMKIADQEGFFCTTLSQLSFVYLGRRTQYNALKDRPAAWDPYGVARVNMSEFLLGQKIINLQIPVHNCAVPDVLGRHSESGRVGIIPNKIVL